ncbi:tetratricopeptide repeat protein, partial [Streptomyces sp. NPDC002276]
RYRASLAIKEELGNRSGISTSYHQLGIIAEARGDYVQAEERYRASLAILEELGDRSGIAKSYGQLGVLRTAQQRPAEAVPYTLRALTLQLEIGSPPDLSLRWLGRQRALIGDDGFRSIIADLLPDDVATTVMYATQPQAEPPQQE